MPAETTASGRTGMPRFTEMTKMFMAMPITAPPSEQEAMWVQMSSALATKPGRLETEYLRQQKAGGLITAILRGRFEGRDRRAFGHLGCCRFKLEVTKVLSVG